MHQLTKDYSVIHQPGGPFMTRSGPRRVVLTQNSRYYKQVARWLVIIGLLLASIGGTALADQETVVVPLSDSYPSLGSPSALVVVDYYFSVRHSGSRDYGTIVQFAEQNAKKVYVRFIPTPYSLTRRNYMAEASLEAYRQGKFRKFMESLRSLRRRSSAMDSARQIAAAAGMNLDALEAAWREYRHVPRLTRNHEDFSQRSTSLPLVVFNDGVQLPRSATNRHSLSSKLAEEYAFALKHKRAGTPRARVLAMNRQRALAAIDTVVIKQGNVEGMPERQVNEPLAGRKLTNYLPPFEMQYLRGNGPKVFLFCKWLSSQCSNQAKNINQVSTGSMRGVLGRPTIIVAPVGDLADDASLNFRRAICAHEMGEFSQFFLQVTVRRYRYYSRRPSGDGKLDEKIENCAKTVSTKRKLDQLLKAAAEAKITLSPSLLVGSRLVEGTKSQSEVQTLFVQEFGPGLLRSFRLH